MWWNASLTLHTALGRTVGDCRGPPSPRTVRGHSRQAAAPSDGDSAPAATLFPAKAAGNKNKSVNWRRPSPGRRAVSG
ncbi:hypothetical protein COCSUDRAFT_61163 [Coccomyxa subellipsoidea C-169]|uniref:Uncharacterized protein n=1 Tax=Coccomyxa subellipsoidea (strain C-169) TaxID=574566 RepID=I0Z6A6_COCSC|nr:hypothetical protein COCSUDRAFT_61163 [Coccomyxa subellipsoidea C-169]EIE26175.1 hypothetical protein COCSUDRAFT_61163 [Coccomyxa subellipsoidea C-169]|eukprot:XP_005650719.1 hypothetical protein COCSUDRAFT_61163 [Coccomyxa subellipsoidea C-169]